MMVEITGMVVMGSRDELDDAEEGAPEEKTPIAASGAPEAVP